MSFFPIGVHVNVIWDPTAGILSHNLWGPPPLPPPAPGTPTFSFEMITMQMWTAGYVLGQNKFTDTVFHRGVFICIDDHDIGALIPDVTIPPVNAFYAIMWPFSSRKMTFKASTVKMNKKPTSCSQAAPVPMPMMTCGDPVTAPTALPIINWMNTCLVGMTLTDFLMGCVRIIVSMAIDAIFEWVPLPKFLSELGGKIAGRVTRLGGRALAASRRALNSAIDRIGGRVGWTAFAIATEAMKKLGLHPGTVAKKAVSSLAGWGVSALEGNPTLSYKVGGGLLPEVGLQAGGDAGDVHGGSVGDVPVGVTTGNTPHW